MRVKRVLFVSRQFPHDIAKSVHGVYLRMRLFLDALAELAETMEMLFYVEPAIDASPAAARRAEGDLHAAWGIRARVTLCPVAPPPDPVSFQEHYVRPATSMFAQLAYVGTSGVSQIAAFDAALGERPDAVFVHRLDAMCPALLTRRELPTTFLDLDDIEHVRWARQIRQPPIWPGKCLYYLQLPALIAGERRAVTLARKAFVCSDIDRRYLARWWRLPNVVTIPNAVAIPADYGHAPESKALLFLATYAYAPNIVAAEFLIKEVWPLVREACPEARLIIAGNKPERIPSFGKHPSGVEFTGFVENLEPLYRRVRIVCCPVLSGGGTRLKILEAAAYGKAIVSTRIGAEGLDLRDGREILLRDGGAAFARACIELLNAPTVCEALGSAAREVVVRQYDRKQIVSQIKDEISQRPGT
jgi:glycosyltransferase involved in cell wall biosynthesis